MHAASCERVESVGEVKEGEPTLIRTVKEGLNKIRISGPSLYCCLMAMSLLMEFQVAKCMCTRRRRPSSCTLCKLQLQKKCRSEVASMRTVGHGSPILRKRLRLKNIICCIPLSTESNFSHCTGAESLLPLFGFRSGKVSPLNQCLEFLDAHSIFPCAKVVRVCT